MCMPLSHFVPAYPSPSPCPHIHSVRLHLYFCPAPRFFRTFFFFSIHAVTLWGKFSSGGICCIGLRVHLAEAQVVSPNHAAPKRSPLTALCSHRGPFLFTLTFGKRLALGKMSQQVVGTTRVPKALAASSVPYKNHLYSVSSYLPSLLTEVLVFKRVWIPDFLVRNSLSFPSYIENLDGA